MSEKTKTDEKFIRKIYIIRQYNGEKCPVKKSICKYLGMNNVCYFHSDGIDGIEPCVGLEDTPCDDFRGE